jgi:hypothetical protein
MENSEQLKEYHRRLWDRYLSIRAVDPKVASFESFWNEFLVRSIVSNSLIDTYETVSRELEERTNAT